MRQLFAAAVAAVLLLAAPLARAGDVIVFAAASTKNVVDDIAAGFAHAGKGHVLASYASSAELAKQIDNGAPAAIFLSADTKWMDYLQQHQLIVGDSRRNLLGNQLVLIAPVDSRTPTSIDGLAGVLGGAKLAIGDPDSVPAGRYGKAALQASKQWTALQPSLVRAKDVRAALALVERKEAAAGIVYATDAMVSRKVRIVATFPAASHPPIVYPVALVAGKDDEVARAFYRFLLGPEARETFLAAGFSMTGAPAATN
ncbi:MAG: molybdate transport system substrate-binding protein [Rhodospirillaceae bacterium]|jgi:molybdate transport system substrate-binding protein|nr:molybdate transport system substrate-binding protein [Rhodospirillaceae bacterium]